MVSSNDNDTWIWVRKESDNFAFWSVVSKLENIQFVVGRVLQTTSNGDLHIFSCCHGGHDVYNPETRAFSRLAELTDCGYFTIDMERYVESFELLNVGTTYV